MQLICTLLAGQTGREGIFLFLTCHNVEKNMLILCNMPNERMPNKRNTIYVYL